MIGDRQHVRPPASLLTDDDVREIIAKPIRALCSEHGPTRVAKSLGLSDAAEKTIRRARDEQTTLCLDTAANLLSLDPHALDGFLRHFGMRSVPADSICDTDALPAMTGAVHKLVVAASPTSHEGTAISNEELLDAKPQILAAFDALGSLLSRIDTYENRGSGTRRHA